MADCPAMTPWSDANLDDAALLRSALDGLPDALVIADPSGVIRLWNAAAERLFGFTREECVGRGLELMIPERFRPAHDAGFARAVGTGTLRTGTRILRTRANHKDGRRLYVDFTFAVLKAPDGRVIGVQALARDATEAHLRQQAAATEGKQA